MIDSALDAPVSLPAAEKMVNASSSTPTAPRKRKLATNLLPLEQRVLLDLPTAANVASVSVRTMKRLACEFPELSVTLNRRRLIVQAKLRAWIAAECPAAKPTRC